MSVDRRLREGLRAASDEIRISGYEAYEAVAAGARRRRLRTRARSAAAVLTAAAAAAYFFVGTPTVRTAPDIPGSGTTTVPTPTAASQTVEGIWQAGPLPMSVIVANLEAHNLSKWVSAYLGTNTATSQVTLTLKLQHGQLTLQKSVDGVAEGVEDSETYSVTGDQIRFAPLDSTCASTFGWQVTADQLTFTFISDTCPPYRGTPDEVFMRALYTSAPYSTFTP